MPPREIDPAPTPNMSWPALLIHSKASRNEIRAALQQNFSKPTLVNTKEGLKIFALGNPPNVGAQTLLSVDVPLSDVSERLKSLEYGNTSETTHSDQQSSSGIAVQQPIELKLQPVFKEEPFKVTAPSAEFSLMCERQRTNVVNGVTDYSSQDGNMLLLAGDQIYRYCTTTSGLMGLSFTKSFEDAQEAMEISEIFNTPDHNPGCCPQTPSPVAQSSLSSKALSISSSSPVNSANFVSEAKICPSDENIIAYVLNKQVYIDRGGKLLYHTESSSKFVSNGVPPYICLEELERYEAIWWSSKEKRLLYEQVDERMVEEASFGVNGKEPSPPMKYPRAGTINAYSTIRMLIIDGDKVHDVGLKMDMRRSVPFEYITRAGFHSDGKSVWVQVMSRQQNECALLLIPETDFELPVKFQAKKQAIQSSDSSNLFPQAPSNDCDFGTWVTPAGQDLRNTSGPLKKMAIVHELKCDHWINTNNSIVSLSLEDDNNPVYRFTYYLETAKGNFLYMISSNIDEWGSQKGLAGLELMAPTVSLNKSMQLKVDEKRKLVYYVANESHPTEWNVCVSSYSEIDEKTNRGLSKRLTELDMSVRSERANSNLAIDFDVGFVCWMTSCKTPPNCRFYAFHYRDSSGLPTANFVAQISMPGMVVMDPLRVERPEIIEYTSPKSNCTFYGMILRPSNFDPNKKYPVLHYVYGGPGIQVVHNDYVSWVPFIKYTKLGFVVVMMDNRGTANRGMNFERQIGGKLGTVEVEDQVEGLEVMAERSGGIMDMSRVVVHGWSYGGYMALLMLATHPKIYRGAIAGGAVTDWKLYDTAYTERYMGYPIKDDLYNNSSVLRLVDSLPDEPNRLMLIHGLMDENVHVTHLCAIVDACLRKGKHHELLLFPNERHGIRNSESASYLDARMMYFIQKCLSEPIMKEEW